MTTVEKGQKKNQGGHNVGCKQRQNAAEEIARKRQEKIMSLTTVDRCPSELRKQ